MARMTHTTVVGSRIVGHKPADIVPCSRCGMTIKIKVRERKSTPTCRDCRSVDAAWANL